MASRVVRPEHVTLPISNGDSITIRKRLNVGEERERLRLFTDNQEKPIPFEHGMATVLAYLIDWTLTDNGHKLEIADKSKTEVRSVIDALDVPTFKEICDAIGSHLEAMQKELDEEKQSPFTDNKNSATSGSPKLSAGPLSTSVN